MAILWADGFEDWTVASTNTNGNGEYETVNVPNTGPGVIAGQGRRGSSGFMVQYISDYLKKTLPASSELFVSLAFRPVGNVLSNIIMLQSGGVGMTTLRANADGSLSAVRGNHSGTVLGTTAAGLLVSGVWTHLQMRVVFSTTVGIVQLRLNGSPTNILNLSTQNTGGPSADTVFLGSNVSNAAAYLDDFVVNDTSGTIANGWLGDVRVDSLLPSGNGDSSMLLGSDGNSVDNYALVNPTVASAGSGYVQSATVNDEDLYQFADLAHNPMIIHGVLMTASALKDDAGYRAMKLRARSSVADAESPEYVLNTSRMRYAASLPVDPATGAAWTKAGLGAAQFGVKVSA